MRAPVLAWLLAVPATAQDPPEPFGHSRHGAPFDEGPRQAAWLMADLGGHVHFPVAGLSPEAQRFFDQGMTQQHGFWYFEAERSFRQVARLQPGCALAYWGMALANVENPKRGAGFAAQAVQRAAALPERERLYVDALAAFHQIDDALRAELQSGDAERVKKAHAAVATRTARDEKQLHRDLIRGFEAVVHAFPEDVEAKALLAIQSWRNLDVGLPIGSHGAVDALLDQVFAQHPLHPAHHYRVHLWDREKAERALRSAAVIGESAPGIAHQWHMGGHVYYRLNRHVEAAWQQEASARVDHAHMARDRVMPFLIHNYGHNQEWLCRSLSHLGRAHEALAVAKNMTELPRHPQWNRPEVDDDIAGYAAERLIDVCEDHELWEEAVAACRDGHLAAGGGPRQQADRLALLGRALFRLGRTAEAERVIADAAALLDRVRAERAAAVDRAEDEAVEKKLDREKTDQTIDEARRAKTDPVRRALDLQRELRGERLLAAGDAKAALAEFLQVASFPKTLLACAHLAAGEPAPAIELLAKDVAKNPHRLPTVGRLVLALRAANQPEHADALRARTAEVAALLGDPAARRSPFAARLGVEPAAAAPAPGPDFGARPPLASLGPAHWQPYAAPGFDLPAAAGGRQSLAGRSGRATLVVFYLGFGCLHCVQQLQALAPQAPAFAAAGVDVIAIGNEPLGKAQAGLAALGDRPLPFPLLADPDLAAFRAWRCHDDFEALPLHGTFLVDGQGRVRWQDVSFEPFVQIEWLLAESQRLLALPANTGSR